MAIIVVLLPCTEANTYALQAMLNVALVATVIFGIGVQKLFFGELRALEIEVRPHAPLLSRTDENDEEAPRTELVLYDGDISCIYCIQGSVQRYPCRDAPPIVIYQVFPLALVGSY
jgi:hypothetical protein